MFVCLANKPNSNTNLDLTIKWTKLNNAFMNKKNARDTNYFTKKFTNCWCGKWLLVNEKVILMVGFRWKPIRGWLHQHFVKIL